MKQKQKQKKLIIIIGAVVGIALVVGLAIVFGKGTLYKGCFIDGLFCDPDPLPPYVPPPASAKLGGYAGPDNAVAGIKSSFTINFTTTKDIPKNGSIRVFFANGFNVSTSSLFNCELAGSFGFQKNYEKGAADVIINSLLYTPANTKIVCHLWDVKNPPDPGTYEGFSIRTYNSGITDPENILDWFDAPAVNIAPAPIPIIILPLPPVPVGTAVNNTGVGNFVKKGTTPAPTPAPTGTGKLKTVSITSTPPDTLVAGTQPLLTVKLTPSVLPSDLPIYGRIFVRFPKEFDLSNPLTVDCNINGGLLAMGVPSDNTVMISRTGSTPTSTSTTQLSGEIVCHLKGIKLPTKDGSYSNFYVATNNGASITIDETTDVPAIVVTPAPGMPTPTPPTLPTPPTTPIPSITVGRLTDASITPASFSPNVPTDLMIKFTTSTPVPMNSRVVINFPTSFNVASATVKGCNPTGIFTGPLFVEAAKNTVSILEIPDLGKIPKLTEITCLLGGITNNIASPTQLYVTISTQDSFNQVLDLNKNVGPLTIETPPTPPAPSPAAKPSATPAPPPAAAPQNPTLRPTATPSANPNPVPVAVPIPPSTPVAPPTPPTPSKCPGVNYPNDTTGHWAQDLIKQAYDLCIFSGYGDGGFHPNAEISRAEGLKASLAAAGIKGQQACDSADCSGLFTDLLDWQKQWVFAAWERKIIEGVKLYIPQRPMTRGEAIIIISKAFGLQPHQGCYTDNCGAGYPDNIFSDIHDAKLGEYLRTAWDYRIIQGKFPKTFDPNGPITRAEIAKIIIKNIQATGKNRQEIVAPK